MNRFIPLSAVALSAAMLMPLSAQAAVNDPTSIPTGESAVRVLSTLAVADQTDESSDRKDHDWAGSADGEHTAYNTSHRTRTDTRPA
jgi:opacity protein-like surface antigen